MALFRICLMGMHDQPVVEFDARDVRDLCSELGPGRFVCGRIEGDGEVADVLIPIARIQLIVGVTE